ncbi:probable glutathione S-transferase [Arachis stenosperma]|uniref:probable glutathione S-transferase n=1 Tax=Arachis stenosperma TaxID=217475 RepID=UPI0025AD61AC|nr:probable glutathione S-transferase [Arachis stenosperma]
MAAEQEEGLKLLGVRASPFSHRVQLALKLKGVQHEYLQENLENKSQLLLKYNPIYKKVPVLLHKEKPIIESLVIIEYIDETWDGYKILPQEPYQRALARFWAIFIAEKCMYTIWTTAWTFDEEKREKGTEEVSEILKTLENELKDKLFFGGDALGFVDIVGVFLAFWFPILHQVVGLPQLVAIENFPKLYDWSQRLLDLNVVKETLPPKEDIFAAFSANLQRSNKATK